MLRLIQRFHCITLTAPVVCTRQDIKRLLLSFSLFCFFFLSLLIEFEKKLAQTFLITFFIDAEARFSFLRRQQIAVNMCG